MYVCMRVRFTAPWLKIFKINIRMSQINRVIWNEMKFIVLIFNPINQLFGHGEIAIVHVIEFLLLLWIN